MSEIRLLHLWLPTFLDERQHAEAEREYGVSIGELADSWGESMSDPPLHWYEEERWGLLDELCREPPISTKS